MMSRKGKRKALRDAWNAAPPIERQAFIFEILAMSKPYTRTFSHGDKIGQNPNALTRHSIQLARSLWKWGD